MVWSIVNSKKRQGSQENRPRSISFCHGERPSPLCKLSALVCAFHGLSNDVPRKVNIIIKIIPHLVKRACPRAMIPARLLICVLPRECRVRTAFFFSWRLLRAILIYSWWLEQHCLLPWL